ncbi:hypothetical protein KYC5002_17590 [Archangium violaceum]|uniref:hypothetical protein n=1 Tax=Archangium violaceum TaxID=83451 RepID=UPI002B2E8AD4|nr:hypothetical protein KYC5002_17590 [Archangium gephyra]
MTQLLDLLLLAPDLQARVLELEAVDGAEPMAERTLRAVAHAGTWAEQRAVWAATVPTERDPRSSSSGFVSKPARQDSNPTKSVQIWLTRT